MEDKTMLVHIEELSRQQSDALRRLDTVERNASDLSRSITALTNDQIETNKEIDGLVKDRYERQAWLAGQIERDKALHNDLIEIKVKLKKIDDANVVDKVDRLSKGVDKIFWLVVGVVISGVGGLVFILLRGNIGV